MSYNTDMQRVVKQAEIQGFRVRETTKGHWQFYAPNGKDIVVASGTSCNHTGWSKFMAELRRAGFAEASTSIGDAIKEALGSSTDVEKTVNGTLVDMGVTPLGKPTTRQILLEVINRHPEGMDIQDLSMVVKSKRPDLGSQAVSVTLSGMASRGEIERKSRGRYHPKQEIRQMEVKPIVNGHAKPVAETSSAPAIPAPIIDEAQVANDIEELEAALVALSRIETVVRRNREVLKKFAELRSMLNSLNLKG